MIHYHRYRRCLSKASSIRDCSYKTGIPCRIQVDYATAAFPSFPPKSACFSWTLLLAWLQQRKHDGNQLPQAISSLLSIKLARSSYWGPALFLERDHLGTEPSTLTQTPAPKTSATVDRVQSMTFLAISPTKLAQKISENHNALALSLLSRRLFALNEARLGCIKYNCIELKF